MEICDDYGGGMGGGSWKPPKEKPKKKEEGDRKKKKSGRKKDSGKKGFSSDARAKKREQPRRRGSSIVPNTQEPTTAFKAKVEEEVFDALPVLGDMEQALVLLHKTPLTHRREIRQLVSVIKENSDELNKNFLHLSDDEAGVYRENWQKFIQAFTDRRTMAEMVPREHRPGEVDRFGRFKSSARKYYVGSNSGF